jgi:DNA-binding transcriptional LysR family regulator
MMVYRLQEHAIAHSSGVIKMKASTANALTALSQVNVRPIRMVSLPVHQGSAVVGFPGKTGSSFSKLLGRLRFRHISLLVALDEHRNLHRAAQAVFMAQPSASKLIQDLEVLFGASLFDRFPTGMQPTELGAVILAFARRSLCDLKRLSTDLEHRRAGRHGSFAIGATTDLLPELVAQAMSDIKQRRPTLAMQLLDVTSEDVQRCLIEGRFDVALGYFRGDPHDGEIDYEAVANVGLCIVGRRDHPFGQDPQLTVHSLEPAAWILHPRMTLVSKMLERSFLRAGAKAPTNVVESSSLTMTINLLQNSDAVTVLPECVVREHLKADRLIRLPVVMADHSIEFGMMTRRRESLSPVAVEFRDILLPVGKMQRRGGQND